jgi:YYY domain-containing protein
MVSDFMSVCIWWGTLFLVGASGYPLARVLFRSWQSRGYLLAKATGLVCVSYLVWLMSSLHILSFGIPSIILSLLMVFVGGIIAEKNVPKKQQIKRENVISLIKRLCVEELFFFVALLFWAFIKAHESSIQGLEKFMDFGFAKSILNSSYFPPADMWYAGSSINYYYFGHFVMAFLTRLSGLDLAVTFNLMLSALFAFTFTMSFAIGRELLVKKLSAVGNQQSAEDRRQRTEGRGQKAIPILGGLFTAFLVTLTGNMQTLYAFTRGYTGDDQKPFWELLWPIREFIQRLPDGLNIYWYANATRFIPFTIHEFPSYSFVVSDVHGHVLSLPFVLLAIALLFTIFGKKHTEHDGDDMIRNVFYGVLVAVLFMTNVLDGPIYMGVFIILTFLYSSRFHAGGVEWWQEKGMRLVGAFVAGPAIIPFVAHFKSFVSGVAMNCPPAAFANRKIGLLLFEGVEKCQHSPLWMWWILWGFFMFCGITLIITIIYSLRKQHSQAVSSKKDTKIPQHEIVLVVFVVYCFLLLIFPEFFYFKDIYPAHFRSNTMFKLGYQAFIMLSIVSGYTIVRILLSKGTTILFRFAKIVFFVVLAPQLFLVSIYPLFSVRSYFNSLLEYKGLYGLTWLQSKYPDDYNAIMWLNNGSQKSLSAQAGEIENLKSNSIVIVEADGDSYTDYARFSAFTGFPTIIGWPVHEWLWRGSYDIVAPRREDVRIVYESNDSEEVSRILTQYDVTYVIVGQLEREKFTYLNEQTFATLGNIVFRSGGTVIYRIRKGL